jgi:ABC-type Fe2+-enterobactin transport system substrate-binding protein
MTDRTIELAIDADTLMALADASSNAELFKAIGYLSQWNMNMAKVRILGGVYDGNPELTATYWRHNPPEPQTIAYQIGAVWHGDHFGFHS